MPVGATVPQPGEHELPPWVKLHVTPPLLGSLLTVAVNGAITPVCTLADAGEIDTAMAGMVMAAEADFVVSAAEAAVNVTLRSLAGVAAGAV